MNGILREHGWLPDNRTQLERWIEVHGAPVAQTRRRVAVFDWDNTMMRGDIGDLVLAHQLERGLVDFRLAHVASHIPNLTEPGRAWIKRACDGADSARVVAHAAWRGTTPDGQRMFEPERTPFYRATYGLIAQLIVSG